MQQQLSLFLVCCMAYGASVAAAFTNPQCASSSFARSMASTVSEVVEKKAPGAGWTPEWEGRTGLPVAEFMQSDLSKPDLSGMWECPLTRWDYQGYVG